MKLLTLTVTQIVPVSPQQAFARWLDPSRPGGPWHGAQRLIFNPTVDGLFFFTVKHAGRTWSHYGRFLRIAPPRKVEYTWVSEGTQGRDSVVTVTFSPRKQETKITLRHSGVPDDAMGRKHRDGWTWVLGMFAQSCAASG